MESKKFEGVEYLKKSDVDELVRSRITKVSERARVAEEKVRTYEETIEEAKLSSQRVIEHKERIAELEREIKSGREKYQSHSTIQQFGFIDPQMRDMVEWTYKREMEKRSKKDQQKLSAWLTSIKENPDLAPITIRPHLQTDNQVSTAKSPQLQVPNHHQENASSKSPPGQNKTPSTNQNVISTNGFIDRDLLDSALRDPEIYRQKREQIRKTWYQQRKKSN